MMLRSSSRRQFLAIGIAMVLSACSAFAGPDITGTWYFASGQTGGSTASVYGTLKLESSGEYEDSHRIAGILSVQNAFDDHRPLPELTNPLQVFP